MKRTLFVLASFLLLATCKGEAPASATGSAETKPETNQQAPPSVADAQTLVGNSAELGEFEFTNAAFTTPVETKLASEPVRASAQELAQAGWITIENGTIALAEKSKSDKRFLMRDNGILDVVPLAKKEMGNVTAVHANPDGTATADFTWHWVANEVGSAFKSGTLHERFATPRTSKATLIWDGSTWSVLKIE